MENNAVINTTLGALLGVMDARANVNIFRATPEKYSKEELLKSNILFNLLADKAFIGDLSIYNARVIGLSVTFGVTSILIEEA